MPATSEPPADVAESAIESQAVVSIKTDVEALEKEIVSLQEEETRVFSYLHELAEMVSADRGTRRVPELIVAGVAKVVKATGAAIYLIDKSGSLLIPQVLTNLCPPLIALPSELRDISQIGGQAQLSFLKLQAVNLDSPVLGTCFQTQVPLLLGRMDANGSLPEGFVEHQASTPVMVAPLNYGSKRLGILVAANHAEGGPFPQHLFEVFCSVAVQSAFALGNAMLQEEALEKRRLESELRAASEVQRVLLPKVSPNLPNFSIAATNVAARIVSGDYYDFVPVDATHTGVVIADVSGKGIPASLIMTTCRGLMRGIARGLWSPSQALARVNRMIYEDVKQDMFISLAYVMLESNSGNLTLARAGHDAPLLFSQKSGEVTRLEPPGVALGVDDGDVFERVTKDFSFTMEPGDCLLLYTDGVNEAENSNGDQFGLERMEKTFKENAPLGVDAVLATIQAEVKAHVQDCVQSDDITLIVIQRK